jgi:hypothetical protein
MAKKQVILLLNHYFFNCISQFNNNAMKIPCCILLCLFAVSCEKISTPTEIESNKWLSQKQDTYPMVDSNFRVLNVTHVNLGWVTARLADSTNAMVNVTDSGSYAVHITAPVVRAYIHSQVLADTAAHWITIDSHTSAHCQLTADIVTIDKTEQN